MGKFKSDTERILESISISGSTFSEFCREYPDTPERGQPGWSNLFRKLEAEVSAGNLEVEREDGGRIESLRVTGQGAARLRELQQRAW